MIKVIKGDITTLAVDAIINAAKRAEREVRKRIVAKLEELLPLCERLKSESNSAANS